MHTNLKTRRDEWLKLSDQEYNGIREIHGRYLLAQMSKYAQYDIAKSRIDELKPKSERILSKWLKYSIYAALAILGVTVFTVLPSIITEETGASDGVAQFGRSIGGIVLVFLGHWSVSLLLTEISIYVQYKSTIKQLNDKLNSSSQFLQKNFFKEQITYLDDKEYGLAKYPSFLYIFFAILSSLVEVGGLVFLFTRDESSRGNYFLIFIVSIVPLFLLWTISFVTAFYEKIPKVNSTIIQVHLGKILDINEEYKKRYPDDDINIVYISDHYLSRMDGLLKDEIEEKESTINHLLYRLSLQDSRRNEIIQIEGSINYYKKLSVVLKNEDDKRQRDALKRLNDLQSENLDESHQNAPSNGEGGSQFHANKDYIRKNESDKVQFEIDNERAKGLLKTCSEKINELESSLSKLDE